MADNRGFVYVADNYAVRRISPEGMVATIGGGSESALTGFFTLTGLALAPDGSLIAADFTGLKRCSLWAGSSDPVITVVSPPSSQVVVSGGPATLSVQATGPSLYFQWRKDGVALAGATGTALSIPAIQPGDLGRYSVIVANAIGSSRPRKRLSSLPVVGW